MKKLLLIIILIPSISLGQVPETEEKIAPVVTNDWKFSLGVDYLFSSALFGYVNSTTKVGNANPVYYSGEVGDSYGGFDGTPRVSIEVRKLQSNSVGFIGSFGMTSKQMDTKAKSSLSTYSFGASLAYRFTNFYVYGGASYTIYDYYQDTSIWPDNATYDYGVDPGIGGNLGLGVLVSENVSLVLNHNISRFVMHSTVVIPANPPVGKTTTTTEFDGGIRYTTLGIRVGF